MMDYQNVLKRAWHIVRNYRAVWIFGIILALTTVSLGTAAGLRGGDENTDRGPIRWELTVKDQQWLERNFGVSVPRTFALTRADLEKRGVLVPDEGLPQRVVEALPTLATILVLVAIVLLIVFPTARYVSEAALIRMVDDYVATGRAHTVGEGLRLGLSMVAWRLFWLDLLMFAALIGITCLLFVPALVPAWLVIDGRLPAVLVGSTVALGLVFFAAALVVVAWTAGTLWVRLARRACALEGLGVIDSLRQGYSMMRQRAKGIAPIWLTMVGVELTYPFLIVPVAIALLGAGVVVGGVVTLLVGSLARHVMALATAWMLAGALGITAFILALTVPLALLGGLREVFQSSTWTLAYRELRALESLKPGPSAEFDDTGLETAPIAQRG